MKKIGILTWHQYHNFGSALQAFALCRTIADMGYDARVINYLPAKGLSDISTLLRCFVGNCAAKINKSELDRFRYSFLRFQRKYMNLTEPILQDELILGLVRSTHEHSFPLCANSACSGNATGTRRRTLRSLLQ